jgi:hypothetical protein
MTMWDYMLLVKYYASQGEGEKKTMPQTPADLMRGF